MNFSKNDVFISMAMTIAVIFMSFTFPALGLTGDAVQENEIPEFNVSRNAADFAREEPEYPARPSQGTLRYVNGSESWEDNRQVDLQTGDPRYLLSFFDDDSGTGENNVQMHVNLIKFNSSGSYTNDVNINESETKTLESVDGAYEVGLSNMELVVNNGPNQTATVDWQVIEQPSDQTWLGRLPVVGSIISGANQLAAVVGWIGATIWHFVTLIMVTIANTLLIFVNIFVYAVDFMVWLITAYGSVVTGAPTAWASVIVAIPGILLSIEFMKVIAVAISLLPTT